MTKKEFEEVLQIYKDQIVTLKETVQQLREEKIKLQEQNFSLQEGLLNIRAPEAYRDLMADRADVPDLSLEERERQRVHGEIQNRYLQNLEKPLFSSADDMTLFLSEALNSGEPMSSKSIHGNDES